jgi:hypothetical protein
MLFLDTSGTQSRMHRLVELLLELRPYCDKAGDTGEDRDGPLFLLRTYHYVTGLSS